MLPGTGRQTESTGKRRENSTHEPGSSGSGRPRCGYIAQPHEAACSFSAKIGINSAQWYSIADLFPGPFALPAPESRREQDLHTEQAECKGANWGSKAPARPLLRALWRVQWCTSRINSTRRKGCLTSSGAFTLMPIFTASMMSFGSPRQQAKCSSVFFPAVVIAVWETGRRDSLAISRI